MADIHLTMGFTEYDHVRDMFSGRIKPEGIELTCLRMEVEESFLRFLRHQEWDVSEMSMGMVSAAVDRGDATFVAIPVFPSRVFRLSGIYVRSDGSVAKPEDLAGKRVAMPQWSQTATIYMRGWMTDTVGIKLTEVDWFQLGADTPGRIDTSGVRPPDGVRLTELAGGSLADMLVAGEVDAVLSASPPDLFKADDPRIARLIPDYQAAEQAYFRHTGIYPIMHTVVIKRSSFEANSWIARNLFNAFEAAKAHAVARMHDLGVSQLALPWIPAMVERLGAEMFPDGDYWPYGIAGSRTTLEAFLGFCHHQGVTARHLTPEDIFVPEARESFAQLKV
jgi:4,5-dihydroxyphthalate decarboxylase